MKINDLKPGDILYTIWLEEEQPRLTVFEICEFKDETPLFAYIKCIDRIDGKKHGIWIDKEVDLNTHADRFTDFFIVSLNEQLIINIFKNLH